MKLLSFGWKAGVRIACVLAGLVLPAVCGGCTVAVSEAQLFHPQRVVADPRGAADVHPFEAVMDDGVRLRGWKVADPQADGSLLFFAGNADTVAWRLGHLRHLAHSLHLDVYAVDYRGFGASEGAPSLARCAKDALAVHDLLAARSPGRPVGLYGYSIGTGFASQLAAKRTPRFLVLQAPPTACEEVIAFWDKHLPWYLWFVTLKPEAALLDPALRPVDFIAKVECPLLVVHGTADTVIPHAMGLRMFEKAGSRRKEMLGLPGLGHNDMSPRDPRIDAALGRLMDAVRK